MSKTIAIFIDGTWNDPTEENLTNVFLLYEAAKKTANQKTLYLAGVGNNDENGWFGQKIGGAFGYGADAKKDEGIAWVLSQYEPGDTVMVFGFSRGAAIARMVAGGLPHVDFLGVFDTVGAFGLPGGLWSGFQKINLFKDMHVGAHVKNALHLVALDETRPAFVPTLMNERTGIVEMWMPGAHADVGGGVPQKGLSDASLGFMARTAAKHGLGLRKGFLGGLTPDLNGPIHYNTDNALGAEPRIACVQRDDEAAEDMAHLHPNVAKRMKSGWWPMAWPPT